MSDDKKINWHPPMQMPESNPVIQFTQKVKHPEKIKINFKLPQWKLKNRNSSLDITLSPAAKKLYNEWRTVLEEEAKIEAVNKPKYYKSDPDISKKFFSELEASAKRLNCNPEDLAAIIYRESHFDPAAKDCTGTYHGLIQMDKTALENSIKFNLENFGNKCGLNPKITYNKYKKLPREEQLKYAEAYLHFRIHEKGLEGKKLTGGQIYTLIHRPADIHKAHKVREHQNRVNDAKKEPQKYSHKIDTKT